MEGCTHQLDPLLRGEPVILSISDPRLMKKKRVSQPMLIIHPFSSDGGKVDKLLFSFPGYGCELLPVTDVKAEKLYMMGLTFRSARLLTEAVKQVFTKEQPKVLTDDRTKNTTEGDNADAPQSSRTGEQAESQEEPDVPPRRRRSQAGGQRDRKGKRKEGSPRSQERDAVEVPVQGGGDPSDHSGG